MEKIETPLTKESMRKINSYFLSLPEDKKWEEWTKIKVVRKEGWEKIKLNKDDQAFLDKIKFHCEGYKEKKKSPYFVFEKESQAKRFIEIQPLFYDRGDLWWLWNQEEKKWEIKDKVDILNGVKSLGINTINSKERTEIINALQQVGRENMPEEIPKECIQFKDKIININTGEEFESTPEYFSTNPIPWKVGETDETPRMDELFKEWVGEEYVKTLYQILAYSISNSQFMQRMIALVGGGSNGKGTFIKLLRKFVGKENCASSELALLATNNFETSMIYKKLVCEMGEVSHNDLKNSNQIKKLSGEDEIRYCFKGKTPFSESSPTTCLINTNSLPTTNDKTIGFYRRWLIIDFPNQFPIKEGIIESIPDIEFENLANKCIKILKEMYKTQKFENEGNYQERMERYEERSNPIMRFIETNCNEDIDFAIPLKKFVKFLNEYLDEKHLRKLNVKEVKRVLNEEGYEIQRTRRENIRDTYVLNLKLVPKVQEVHKNQTHTSRVNLVSNLGTIGTIGTID
jgi:P4 family phage/plasmid primase-like protien